MCVCIVCVLVCMFMWSTVDWPISLLLDSHKPRHKHWLFISCSGAVIVIYLDKGDVWDTFGVLITSLEELKIKGVSIDYSLELLPGKHI